MSQALTVVKDEPAASPAPDPNLPPDDIDDRAVWEAHRATQQQPVAPATPARPAPAAAGGPQPMIPKARFDQVNTEARQLADLARTQAEEIAYLRGAQAVLTAGARPPAAANTNPQPTAAPSVKDLMDAQVRRRLEASDQFDRGEITMRQFQEINTDVENQIRQLGANHQIEWIKDNLIAPVAQPGLSDQREMQRQIAELEARHPWSAVLSETEIAHLADEAKKDLAKLGHPVGKGPAETARLRAYVAALADAKGPLWYPANHEKTLAVAARRAAAQAQPAAGAPAARPAAQAGAPASQAMRKVEIAARQPPNISQAGFATSDVQAMTPERIASMNEDEILALPPEMRRRLIGTG